MVDPQTTRIRLATLRRMKAEASKFAMLTAYDHPTARAAQAAGVHSLLVGDSLGNVVLGQPNTRGVPLDLMIPLAKAARLGAPNVYLIGDVPFEAMHAGEDGVLNAADRFVREAECDAVKFEAESRHAPLVRKLADAGYEAIVHLGLRPQSVLSPDGYRAQARDEESIAALVADAQRMAAAGAAMILLEAVPPEASMAVVDAIEIPVIGCGAGPACDGHVVVTHDMLGLTPGRPPRFVPVLANLGAAMEQAMRRYAELIAAGGYPAPEHMYPMKRAEPAASSGL